MEGVKAIEFTDAELSGLAEGFRSGVPCRPEVALRLVKLLQVWNERAHQAIREGLDLAAGLNESACLLNDAGTKWKARAEAAELQVCEAVAALRIVRDEYRSGRIESAFGLPIEIENAIRKADGIPPIPENRSGETERLIEIELRLNSEIRCDCGVPGCNKLYDHRK